MKRVFSFGQFPERSEFDEAFSREYASGLYEIRHGSESAGRERPEGRDYTCSELWDELHRLFGRGEESDSWCSDILGTLGFEWI